MEKAEAPCLSGQEVKSVDFLASPNDTSCLNSTEKIPWLTLITCRGYDKKTNTSRWRTVVRAVLVSIR